MKKTSINNWKTLKLISKNNISNICKIEIEEGKIAVVKKTSLPISDQDAALLMERGKILFIQDATNYYMQMMNNEIAILKKLTNEKNILNLYDTFQNQEDEKYNYYIIMEYAEDIISHFNKEGVSEQDVITLGIDICSALESCNKINVLHNDIKPANIFYDGTNYKLGDFGNSTIGATDNIITFGTPNYLSPEVYNRNSASEASDIYSLGLVMYHLLSGNLPFVNNKVNEKDAFKERMNGTQIPNINGINSQLMDIVIKACNFEKTSRYQSVSEMKKNLQNINSLNTTKKQVVFSNTKMNDTISVFDNELIARQNQTSKKINTQKKKKKVEKIFKKWFKRGMIAALIILLLFSISFIYSRNKKCDLGYINKNGVCTKGYYYCDTGYSLNEKKKCQKTIKAIDAKVSYSCPSGYTYTNESCVNEEIQEPTLTYQCLDGFSLNGSKCEKIETNDAVVTYTCPKGYANMNGVCVKGDEQNAKVSYSCPSGYTTGPFIENGTYKCSKYISSSSTIDATPKYTCQVGTLNSSNKCINVTNNVAKSECNGTTSNEKCVTTGGYWCSFRPNSYGCSQTCTYTCTITSEPKITYSCDSGGTLNGSKCTYSGGNTIKVNAIANYSCPKGYDRIGTKCVYGKQINGTKEYKCLDSQTLVGDKCQSIITTDAVEMYTCPEGFIASGVTCVQNDFPQPVKKYTCSRVYTLNGEKCEQYEIKPPKVEFTE